MEYTVVSQARSVPECIGGRFACRAFLADKPVARDDIAEILEVASRAASGTNTQPWKVRVVEGSRRDELVERVLRVDDSVAADPALKSEHGDMFGDFYPREWVSPYIDRKRENGWSLYGTLGIVRGEKHRMQVQRQRNFQFFDAPVGLMFTIDNVMGRGSLIDYGMFLQNIMLMARHKGLDTCPQAAWNHYSKTVLDTLEADPNEVLVLGMALGYADPAAPENSLQTPRASVDDFVRWL